MNKDSCCCLLSARAHPSTVVVYTLPFLRFHNSNNINKRRSSRYMHRTIRTQSHTRALSVLYCKLTHTGLVATTVALRT